MKKFSERILYTEEIAETDQPYIYLLKGSRLSLQIDAGNSGTNVLRFNEQLTQSGLEMPDLAAVTHWHWDHTFGMPALACPVIAGRRTNEKLKEVQKWEWTEKALAERLACGEEIPFCSDCMHREYGDIGKIRTRTADIVFETDLTIDLGGVHAVMKQIDTPHTRDAVMILVPEEGVLFGGDADAPDYYDYDGRYDMKRLKAFIEYLEQTEFQYYLRGHAGGILTKEMILKEMKDIAAENETN